MNPSIPHVRFGEFLKINLRPFTLAQDQDANLVGVKWYGEGPFHREFKPALNITKKSHFVIRAGDVIYNKLFAWKGSFGIIPPKLDGMYVSDKFPTYTLDRNQVDENYLKWYFHYSLLWDQARDMSTGSAALSKFTLNPPKFLELTMPLPPLVEQQRIAATLEHVMVKVEAARKERMKALNEIENISSLFRKVIFLRSNGKSNIFPLKEITERITKGESPGWQGYQYIEDGPLFITSENVRWGFLDLKNVKKIPDAFHQKLNRSQLKPNDILINLVGASIGRTSIVPQNITNANVNQAVAVITPKSKLDSAYLMHFILSPIVQQTLQNNIVETARPNISLIDIRHLMIPVPPLTEQRRIVAHLNRLQAKVDEVKMLQAETEREMVALVPAVLAKAFGESE